MVVGQMPVATDVVVIGSGPGGSSAALGLASSGADVTLVERSAFGGVCLNVGCIPSKSLLEIADAADVEREVAWGVRREVHLDAALMRHHMCSVIDDLAGGLRSSCEQAGVKIIAGDATVLEPGHVVVATPSDAIHLHCSNIVLATGSRPRVLPDLPVDGHRVLDSTSALELQRIPRTLAIVGGGYIGVELGTAFAKLGTAVTIVEATGQLLPEMSQQLGRAAARGLAELGVDVLTNTLAVGLTPKKLQVEGPDGPHKLRAEQVIVAVGRVPNTEDLGIESLPVDMLETGHITVDEQMRATPGIYAIGDIVGGPALAHKASAEARVVVEVINGTNAAFDVAAMPLVVFSDPEIVAVGIQPDNAPRNARSATVPLRSSGRARAAGRPNGFVTLVADNAGAIIGGQIVGSHASELASEVALAIELAATAEDLAATIHPHPTIAELIAICAGQLARAVRTPNE